MCQARIAAECVTAWCMLRFPGEGPTSSANMASTMLNGSFADVFDHEGFGTHKYIPADRLTDDLGKPQGAGVYAYYKLHDGSYILLTCDGPLAYWDGTDDGKAKWAMIETVRIQQEG